MADVIIYAKFYVEKLRGYRYTDVQTFVSPIEMAGHPYNSDAEQCQMAADLCLK